MSFANADRVAFVTVLPSDASTAPDVGRLDSEAVMERLSQSDASFYVVPIDGTRDIAEQIDERLGDAADEPPSTILFYASAEVIEADGEVLLQLDATHPETGDALSDIIDALTEPAMRAPDSTTLLLLELRSKAEDAIDLATVAQNARQAVQRSNPAVELIVAVQGRKTGAEAAARSTCSAFTRAFLRELDETDPNEGLYAAELVERAFDGARQPGLALAHVAVDPSFPLLIVDELTMPQPTVGADSEEPIEQTDPDADDSIPPVDSDIPTTLPSSHAPPPVPDEEEEIEPEPPTLTGPPAPPPPAVSIPPARPSQPPGPQEVLAEADQLADSGHEEEAIARYRKAISVVGASLSAADADAERARIHLKIADAMLRLGRGREAIASFEKSLSLAPEIQGATRALRTLLTLYLGEGDRRGVSSVEERLLARLSTPENDETGPKSADGSEPPSSKAFVSVLIAFGRAWMTELGDPLRARERFEHARALAPSNREVVRLLIQLAEKDGRTEELLELKRIFADLDPDPKSRATNLYDHGRDLLQRGRDDQALDALDAALEADPGGLEPLALLSQLLGDRQEWGELEAAYRRMLGRTARLEADDLRRGLECELNKRLGQLLLQHLDDPKGALESLSKAVDARPDDIATRRAAAEVAQLADAPLEAEKHLMVLVAQDIRDEASLRALFELSVRLERVERATDLARVLHHLGYANDRERVVATAEVDELSTPPIGVLSKEDWVTLREPVASGVDAPAVELVAGVFHAAGHAIVKTFAHLAARAGRLAPLDESLRVDAATTTVSAARSLYWASHVLGLEPPALYLEESSAEGMTAVLRDSPVTVVGSNALRGRTVEELRFLSGYHLSAHLREHRIVRLAPTIDDLAACFLAAVIIAVPDTPVPERIRSLVELIVPSFAAFLGPEDEEALEDSVMAFDAAGGRAHLVAYQRAVERASLRAGWLLCGSLSTALTAVGMLASAGAASGGMTRVERENEILAFSVSDAGAALRAQLHAR